MSALETSVLIVGGGPVGKTLAIELGRRGIGCLLVEAEARDARRFPTTNHVASSTLECFRRWGMSEPLREASAELPFRILFVTGIGGYELTRADWGTNAEIPPLAHTPETPLWCPTPFFNPVIGKTLDEQASVEQRYRTRLVALSQGAQVVTARVREEDTGDEHEVRADYVVGCDGAAGTVRRELGIEWLGVFRPEGAPPLLQTYFRSKRLLDHLPDAASQVVLVRPGQPRNVLVGVDGRETYRLALLAPQDRSEANVAAMIRGYLGVDVDVEILHQWEAGQFNRAVCRSYRSGRVFLAGDAAHMHTPRGGMAANTGIQDAVNLGWKLAAVVEGWGGEGVLESYGAERRPRALALHLYQGMDLSGEEPRVIGDAQVVADVPVDDRLTENSAAGEAARRDAAARLWEAERTHFRKPGLEFGWCYRSSVCVDDGTPVPTVGDWGDYTPSGRPGCRAPHAWLAHGRSTLDWFGDGFALLRFGRGLVDTTRLEAAFASQGAPLRVQELLQPDVGQLYGGRLSLVRPDGVVAWRADEAPEDPAAVVAAVCGHTLSRS